jgi:hypothetical protein
MKLSEFKAQLQAHPEAPIVIALPDRSHIPAHFHVTEVGHVGKNFDDCGGKFSATESCVLQIWMASERDDGHRLTAGKLSTILGFAGPILRSDDLPVEVEYEDGLVSQFPVEDLTYNGYELSVQLRSRHTTCLARDRCGKEPDAVAASEDDSPCCGSSARCC